MGSFDYEFSVSKDLLNVKWNQLRAKTDSQYNNKEQMEMTQVNMIKSWVYLPDHSKINQISLVSKHNCILS